MFATNTPPLKTNEYKQIWISKVNSDIFIIKKKFNTLATLKAKNKFFFNKTVLQIIQH